jgi:hypothetical protein
MVAIVSGNSLGLELTSLGTLGSQGLWGSASQGNNGEQVYVNAATGNLVVQRRDEFLASRGLDNPAIRTYNSLGLLNSDDNNDNWALGVYAQQLVLSGTSAAPSPAPAAMARPRSTPGMPPAPATSPPTAVAPTTLSPTTRRRPSTRAPMARAAQSRSTQPPASAAPCAW